MLLRIQRCNSIEDSQILALVALKQETEKGLKGP
jgi:hypothetical protein